MAHDGRDIGLAHLGLREALAGIAREGVEGEGTRLLVRRAIVRHKQGRAGSLLCAGGEAAPKKQKKE